MPIGNKKASFLLLAGDVVVFVVSLFAMLIVRYQTWPSAAVLGDHLRPFSFLFLIWVLVFYMSGLYDKQVIFLKHSLSNALLKTQSFNILLAALFFFLVPSIGIAPKTNLIIYLVISLALISFWRLWLYPRLSDRRTRLSVALIASGPEAQELVAEVNGNPRYGMAFEYVRTNETVPDPETLAKELAQKNIALLVVDTDQTASGPVPSFLYALSVEERRYHFVEFESMYEEVFDRIPLSRLTYAWFVQNVAQTDSVSYAFLKRVLDLFGGFVMGILTVCSMPFIYLAMRLEGPGPLFIVQDRLGERGSRIRTLKFRSMRENDAGAWSGENGNRVTKVGAVLRKTSLDEFPQCLNILSGELSLIGPRNDIEALGERLRSAIPYYSARYLVKPGITGWAQINQQYEQNNISPQSIAETKTRLAYDFYYLKHRSFGLDIVIALKTVKRMFFRVSSW